MEGNVWDVTLVNGIERCDTKRWGEGEENVLYEVRCGLKEISKSKG